MHEHSAPNGSAGVARRIAFVIGGAACVWEDLKRARNLCVPDIVAVVNDMGVDYAGKIDYWVSYHSDRLAKWADQRKKKGLPPPAQFWSGLAPVRFAPRKLRHHTNRGGSSGMLGAYVALDEGQATHVILIGVPINPEMPHYHSHNRNQAWKDGKNYQRHWRQKYDELHGRVKSMSGWTAELLGSPTIEWLRGDNNA